ncbi:MAG: helix-hairpin-helix domain-containing protein, partial [bacterium]
EELIAALADGNVARLISVPGVGKRTAERLVVDLRDRVSHLARTPASAVVAAAPRDLEAVSALVNLGYRQAEAERAVRAAMTGGASELGDVIRGALQKLSG